MLGSKRTYWNDDYNKNLEKDPSSFTLQPKCTGRPDRFLFRLIELTQTDQARDKRLLLWYTRFTLVETEISTLCLCLRRKSFIKPCHWEFFGNEGYQHISFTSSTLHPSLQHSSPISVVPEFLLCTLERKLLACLFVLTLLIADPLTKFLK